jgi:hypothetical protein
VRRRDAPAALADRPRQARDPAPSTLHKGLVEARAPFWELIGTAKGDPLHTSERCDVT